MNFIFTTELIGCQHFHLYHIKAFESLPIWKLQIYIRIQNERFLGYNG